MLPPPVAVQAVMLWDPAPTTTPEELDAACAELYGPLLAALRAAPAAKLAVAVGGHLLDHLARTQAAPLAALVALQASGQVEVLGGPFYDALPALLPEADLRGQVQMTAEYWYAAAGSTPRGFFLPALSWPVDLPVLLADADLPFGFLSSAQLSPGTAAGLVAVEHCGQRLGAFVLDSHLSHGLVSMVPAAWARAAAERGARHPQHLVNVWLRPEARSWGGAAVARLAEWLAAVAAEPHLRWSLPSAAWAERRAVRPARLRAGAPAELDLALPPGVSGDVSAAALAYPELDTLHRRMLRASARLRAGIQTMEDLGRDGAWSGKLATAQRALFAAQAGGAYWYRSLRPGFLPRGRDAIWAQLLAVEAALDALSHAGDFLVSEAEDLDGDLLEDVLVASRSLSAWLQPACGGAVRVLEDRPRARSLFDAAGRGCCVGAAPAAEVPALGNLGMRPWLLPPELEPAAWAAATPRVRLAAEMAWQVHRCGIEGEGEARRFCLRVSAQEAAFTLVNEVEVASAAPRLHWRSEATARGAQAGRLALEVPFRLGPEAAHISADGARVPAGPAALTAVSCVRIDGGPLGAWALSAAAPVDWWVLPVTPHGGPAAAAILVPWVRVERAACLDITLAPA